MIKILLFLFFLLPGCSEDNLGTDPMGTFVIETEQVQTPDNFNTRLNSSLLINGQQCFGGETAETNGQVLTCSQGQWLIVIDNINTCNDAGVCTDTIVPPIIANLTQLIVTDPQFLYFNIIPQSAVTLEQQTILNSVNVRSNTDGTQSTVILK